MTCWKGAFQPADICVVFTDVGSLFSSLDSPSLSSLVKRCHHNTITHLLHPHRQPVRLPSPTLPISPPLFLPHPSPTPPIRHPHLYSITATSPPYTFLLRPPLPFLPRVSAAALGRNTKGGGSDGERVGRCRPRPCKSETR